MNKALALLVALPLLCSTATAADRVENMKKLTVLVTSEGFLAGGRGSGILMDSTHVLTCAHMASAVDDEFFVYTYPFGTVVKAKVESINVPADLLLLRLDAPVKAGAKPVFQPNIKDGDTVVKAKVESINVPADLLLLKLDAPVKTGIKPVFQPSIKDGDTVTVVGNAVGAMKWYVTRGVISGRERDFLMTDAQVHPGNSGGPWFNDKGEVVAISDWGLKKYPDIAGGVSSEQILATLKGWEDQKTGMAALLKLLGGVQ